METFSSKNSAELCLWAGAQTLLLLRLWPRQFLTTERGEVGGLPGPAWAEKGGVESTGCWDSAFIRGGFGLGIFNGVFYSRTSKKFWFSLESD